MKNKQAKKARRFSERVNKYFKYQMFLVFAFILLLFSYQTRADVFINEIMLEDKDSSKNEFVELYNSSDKEVSLDKYSLKKKTSSGSESTLLTSSKFFGTIKPHGYFVISHPDYATKINSDAQYSSSSYSVAENNTVLLYDAQGKLLDKVGFGSAKDYYTFAAKNPDAGKSIGRINGKDKDNSSDFVELIPTPGKENKLFEEVPIEKKAYSNEIQITEIYPYPLDGEEEFIELYNGGDQAIDLNQWALADASKTGKYIFPSQTIEAKKYLVIYGKVFKFALNNSGLETVTLTDPDQKIVSNLTYYGTKKGASYNFNGKDWHWSKFKTPGGDNVFEDIPSGEVKVDDEIYVNVYANFEISGLSKNAKVTWDFGDGHKSYLQKTRHKFLCKRKYYASVKFSQGSEDVIKDFTIDVQDFPHPKLKIIQISANPKGADTGKEYLTIKNKSRKKINLKGWSIATGWKKFINHPIREEFIIKRGKSKQITNVFSSFTLNNTKAKIQLRYPDGKVTHEVKYKKEEGISDDEIYTKQKGGGWKWSVSAESQKSVKSIKPIGEINADEQGTMNIEQIQQPVTGNQESELIKEQGLVVKEDKSTKKVEIKILQPNNFSSIDILEPQVLGAESVREADGQYFFTPETQAKEHYAISFWKNISESINEKLNSLLNSL